MKIGEALTRDDKKFLAYASRVLPDFEWRFIYHEYLEIFSNAAISEKAVYKKANQGRRAANAFLLQELAKKGLDHWRDPD